MHRLLILTLLLGSLRVLALRAEEPVYEFRGVWVATVTNIDWPSQRELPVEELKKEALEIIGLHDSLGMNALILQVRPSGVIPPRAFIRTRSNTEKNLDLLVARKSE